MTALKILFLTAEWMDKLWSLHSGAVLSHEEELSCSKHEPMKHHAEPKTPDKRGKQGMIPSVGPSPEQACHKTGDGQEARGLAGEVQLLFGKINVPSSGRR